MNFKEKLLEKDKQIDEKNQIIFKIEIEKSEKIKLLSKLSEQIA